MQKVASFKKVSYAQFENDFFSHFPQYTTLQIKNIYDNITLPMRATTGSAGYDFFTPLDITLESAQEITIPTGICTHIIPGWVLALFPRSSLGFKYRLQLNNTVGIIDSDYVTSDNEGHIFIRITNDSLEPKTVHIKENQGFVQGIFLPFGIVEDDATTTKRNGGLGSTTK